MCHAKAIEYSEEAGSGEYGLVCYLEFLVRPEYRRLQDDIVKRGFMILLLYCPIFVLVLSVRRIDALVNDGQYIRPGYSGIAVAHSMNPVLFLGRDHDKLCSCRMHHFASLTIAIRECPVVPSVTSTGSICRLQWSLHRL